MLNDDVPNGASVHAQPEAASYPRGRRLSDKLLHLFHEACDQGRYDVARTLLSLVEMENNNSTLNDGQPNRRKALENLVAAHERLWHIVHIDTACSDLNLNKTF